MIPPETPPQLPSPRPAVGRAARVSAAILALALAAPSVAPAMTAGDFVPSSNRVATAQIEEDDSDDPDDLSDDDADSCEVTDDDEGAAFCDNEVIVRFVPGKGPGDLGGLHEEQIDAIPSRNTFLLRIPADRMDEHVLDEILKDGDVDWAELNYVGNAPQGNPSRFFPRGRDAADPQAATVEDVENGYGVGATGADRLRCVEGRDVTVAVIDTGLDATHPLFGGRVTKPWNAFTGEAGPDVVAEVADGINNDDDLDADGDPLIDEGVGHGTHVAGIVLQAAPRARVMPIKALDSDGSGQAFYLARAIAHATSVGADVINLSLGSEGESIAVQEAVQEALNRNVVVVAAAGNGGSGEAGIPPIEYPAANVDVVAVGATDRDDQPATFSSRYGAVDLSAPGVQIASAFPISAQGIDTGYATWSGTSMAAPWVSGAVALMLDRNGRLKPDAIARKLRATADPIAGDDTGMGAGRLDVADAISCKKKGGKGKGKGRR